MRRIQASTGAIAPMHRIAESPPRRTIVVETTGAAGSEAAPASEAESETTPPPRASISDVFRAYLALTKPRIVELLLITTVPAMFLAARLQYNALPHWLTVVAVVVAGALAAGSANAINCYIDRDIDHLMRRTQRRPIPQHTVQPRNALIFGLIAGTVSVVMIGLASNLLAAALTLGAIVYYDVVYTIWLKRTTAMNTVWGGVCGSAPVLIGWAAVTGTLSLEAWILFAVVFLWQPPHFFALAIKYADDYAAAGIPMLTVVAPMRRVGIESVVYAWLTLAASLALWPLGMTPLYAAVALITGGLFCLEAHKMLQRIRRDQPIKPMRLFHWSTTYLTLLFVAVAVDSFLV